MQKFHPATKVENFGLHSAVGNKFCRDSITKKKIYFLYGNEQQNLNNKSYSIVQTTIIPLDKSVSVM